jgi:hypothetical protein
VRHMLSVWKRNRGGPKDLHQPGARVPACLFSSYWSSHQGGCASFVRTMMPVDAMRFHEVFRLSWSSVFALSGM